MRAFFQRIILILTVATSVCTVHAGDDSSGRSNRAEQTLSDMLFARIEIPRGKIYSQQVFDMTLKIYAREGLNLTGNFEPYGFPTSRINLGPFGSLGQTRVKIDGAIYKLYRFSTTARALSSGDYSFQPGLRAAMRVDRGRSRQSGPFGDSLFDSFFDRGRIDRVEVPVDPLALEVLPLPSDGRPDSFSGAVGEFSFSVSVKPKNVDAGNPVTVTMLIEGRGNIDNITAPRLRLGDEFKTYEPRLVSADGNGGSGGARKVFEEVVIPKSEEIEQLPAIEFSYFSPDEGGYRTVSRGPFPLKVSPASSAVVQISGDVKPRNADSEPEILGSDIVYLKEPPEKPESAKLFEHAGDPAFWALQALPVAGLAILFGWRRRRDFLQGNIAAARRQKAPKAARAALTRAAADLKSGDRRSFFEELWQSAADYFGNRLNLAPGEVGAREAMEFARKADLAPELRDDLARILDRCEQERFAAAAEITEGWTEEGREMLDAMRTILKRCDRAKSGSGAIALGPVIFLGALLFIASARLGIGATVGQDSPARSFARAAEAYDAGELDLALREYRALLEQGQASPQLYFNLGNTHFRKRRFGRAILNYRKAWYLAPNDPDVQANLELALRETGALVPELTPVMRLFTSLSADRWLKIAVGLYWFGAALCAICIFSGGLRRLLFRLLAVVAVALLIALVGLAGWLQLGRRSEAVIVGESREALFAPIADSTAHFTLPVGSIVHMRDNANGWVQVEVNDMSGWIEDDSCERVGML